MAHELQFTPAGYSLASTGTHLAMALWPAGEGDELNGRRELWAGAAVEAMNTQSVCALVGEAAHQRLRRHCHPPTGTYNHSTALAPGDAILTTVIEAGSIQIAGARETLSVHMAHASWIMIAHPTQAAVDAAEGGFDPNILVSLEQISGPMWVVRRTGYPNAAGCRRPPEEGNQESPTSREHPDPDTPPRPGPWILGRDRK